MDLRKVIFVKNRKKRASDWLFWPIIYCSFDRIDFLTKYGHDSMVLFMKNLKNYIRAPCFWENGRFLRKYGHESSVFFREWKFFWQIMGMRALSFSWKIGKRASYRASYWLYWPIQTSRKNAWYNRSVLRKNPLLGGGGGGPQLST